MGSQQAASLVAVLLLRRVSELLRWQELKRRWGVWRRVAGIMACVGLQAKTAG